MDAALEDRIAEIEHRQAHFVLASNGTDGWVNFIESRLLQERQFEHGVLIEVIASLRCHPMVHGEPFSL